MTAVRSMVADVRSDGVRHTVTVDGKDISNVVSSAFICFEPGVAGSSVDLHVMLPAVEVLGIPAEVIVSDDARELLIKGGWAPPDDG